MIGSMALTLHTALDLFKDNLHDIEHVVRTNLQHDLDQEREDNKHLGTSWIADEVRKLRVEQRFGDTKRRLRQIAYYRQSLTNPRPGHITPPDIERARSYPIENLYVGKLRRQNKDLWGKCPFHNNGVERTPSFHINTTKNMWYCHGCSTGGDSINYYMRVHGVGFINAVKKMV